MSEIAALIARYPLPSVVAAVFLFILLRGELQFRYPRSGKKP